MRFHFERIQEILNTTPDVVTALLQPLSEEWLKGNEGAETWSAREVLAHLIVCEETAWIPRVRVLLGRLVLPVFAPIDMTAHFPLEQSSSLDELLTRFRRGREAGMEELEGYALQEPDFDRKARHPVIGEVDLRQLLSAWATHDLMHLAQMARVIARQNRELIGGFARYLKI